MPTLCCESRQEPRKLMSLGQTGNEVRSPLLIGAKDPVWGSDAPQSSSWDLQPIWTPSVDPLVSHNTHQTTSSDTVVTALNADEQDDEDDSSNDEDSGQLVRCAKHGKMRKRCFLRAAETSIGIEGGSNSEGTAFVCVDGNECKEAVPIDPEERRARKAQKRAEQRRRRVARQHEQQHQQQQILQHQIQQQQHHQQSQRIKQQQASTSQILLPQPTDIMGLSRTSPTVPPPTLSPPQSLQNQHQIMPQQSPPPVRSNIAISGPQPMWTATPGMPAPMLTSQFGAAVAPMSPYMMNTGVTMQSAPMAQMAFAPQPMRVPQPMYPQSQPFQQQMVFVPQQPMMFYPQSPLVGMPQFQRF